MFGVQLVAFQRYHFKIMHNFGIIFYKRQYEVPYRKKCPKPQQTFSDKNIQNKECVMDSQLYSTFAG